jgi:hypothetical protein
MHHELQLAVDFGHELRLKPAHAREVKNRGAEVVVLGVLALRSV